MKDLITNRRQKARQLMSKQGLDAIVVANAENLQYYTNVMEPSLQVCCVLVLPQKGDPSLAVMWLDEEAAYKEVNDMGICTYNPATQGKVIAEVLEKAGITKGKVGMDSKAMDRVGKAVKRELTTVETSNISRHIDRLRCIKDEGEIKLIRQASRIADEGMKAALGAIKAGTSELQVASTAEHRMIDLGSDAMKHHPMVASGSRSKLVHAFASQKKIAQGEVVTVDVGAVYNGYCSDIARSFFVGKPDEDLIQAFALMQESQAAVLDQLRPGMTPKQIEDIARKGTNAAGLDLIGHMGHGVGLRVEEHPLLLSSPKPENDPPVERNMVLSLFQGSLQLKNGMGLRLEDTVWLTDSGAQLLTTYPRELFTPE